MSVISLYLGQAGVQLGDICWQQFTAEHCLDPSGSPLPPIRKSPSTITLHSDISLSSVSREWREAGGDRSIVEGIDSFFTELPDGRFEPKALFIDTEPSVIDAVMCGPYRGLFGPEKMIRGQEDAANNFARGRSGNNTVVKEAPEQLRKLEESCDRLQGYVLYHSVGGGTGSGYHARLLSQMQEAHTKTTVLGTTIQTSPRLSTSVVEPYNAVLNTSETLDLVNCVFICDNEALFSICTNRLGMDNPAYSSLNRVLAATLSSITASLRFKGSLNADFKDFQTNLVPYPRVHFATMSYAPIVNVFRVGHESLSITDLSLQAFQPGQRLSMCSSESGRYMACCLLYRGDVTPKDVNTALAQLKSKGHVQFVPWCPTGIKVGLNTRPAERLPDSEMEACQKTVCMVANTTALQRSWENLNHKFQLMLAKKAFVHWYTGEGMEEGEFTEAQSNLLTLENDYNELS